MSLGSFLKRVTTIPKKGPLSVLRPIFGRTPMDELGTLAGFAVGGPAGAAAGAGLGSLVHGAPLSSAIGNAAKGYGAGVGYNALASGLGGGGLSGALGEINQGIGKPLGGIGRALIGGRVPGSGTDTVGAGTGGRGIGGIIGQGVDFFTDPQRGGNRLGLLSTLLGTGGAFMQGQAEDRNAQASNALAQGGLDLNRTALQFQIDQANAARARTERMDPYRDRLLDMAIDRLGTRRNGG